MFFGHSNPNCLLGNAIAAPRLRLDSDQPGGSSVEIFDRQLRGGRTSIDVAVESVPLIPVHVGLNVFIEKSLVFTSIPE